MTDDKVAPMSRVLHELKVWREPMEAIMESVFGARVRRVVRLP
jgi:hypothetical protein